MSTVGEVFWTSVERYPSGCQPVECVGFGQPPLAQGIFDHHVDMLVLDVRGRDEFVGEHGHIAGARNVPVDELAQRLSELGDYLERPVAIVCRTDKRSVKAARTLTKNGFADVHIVQGGMTSWNEAGYVVER